jgi:hypothetical protein
MAVPHACSVVTDDQRVPWVQRLNGVYHKRALQIYIVIVLAHWAEHLAQAVQVYILGWPRPQSLGFLGYVWPWLVDSEFLHYFYAIIMLIGLWILRSGFVGRSYIWWMVAFWIQFWHHIEHAILQGQALAQHNLFNSPVPVSIVQLWIPRVELHLFYNTVVFVPMVIAMYYHMFPSAEEEARQHCTCTWHPRVALA